MNKQFHQSFVEKAKLIFGDDFIPLHRPVFEGNERQYLIDCIDSNFVSSVGAKVTEFEEKVAEFIGSKYAIATVNGTAALHIAIEIAGVKPGDEVISQALTFIAVWAILKWKAFGPILEMLEIKYKKISDSPAEGGKRKQKRNFSVKKKTKTKTSRKKRSRKLKR